MSCLYTLILNLLKYNWDLWLVSMRWQVMMSCFNTVSGVSVQWWFNPQSTAFEACKPLRHWDVYFLFYILSSWHSIGWYYEDDVDLLIYWFEMNSCLNKKTEDDNRSFHIYVDIFFTLSPTRLLSDLTLYISNTTSVI